MMKIGLFCGCFDPIHKGHIKAALIMKEAAGLDIVYLVPASGKYSNCLLYTSDAADD